MARHRSFSSEFKRQISREFLEGRAGMHELARRYSLSRNLIRLWVRKYEAGEFTDELAEAVRIAEYERKIAELERKVGQLTMEVDLLKKGARLAHASNDANYSIVSGPALSPSRKDVDS
jgi:transposase